MSNALSLESRKRSGNLDVPPIKPVEAVEVVWELDILSIYARSLFLVVSDCLVSLPHAETLEMLGVCP